ncbi:hypothetical protein CDL15_Pgr008642 [Punica granatum]|uniref:Uncharacterized protein n=1 Tax=Punica granatum TaxID=22663 RepID=A0A218XE48_PUNGR|nr:hypothetical protein CDL15_Pgr008642 [Punica granatum]
MALRAFPRVLICRRPVSLLGVGALLSHAMRDSSSNVDRLRTPRDRELESTVVLVACGTCDPVIISKSRVSD